MLLPQVPIPPDQGAKMRNLSLLRALSVQHEVHLFCFAPRQPHQEHLRELERFCASYQLAPVPRRHLPARLWRMLTSRLPDLANRFWSAEARERIVGLAEKLRPRVLHASNLELARYLFALDGPVTVLDEHNVESLLQLRAYRVARGSPRDWHRALYSWVQWRRLATYERQACQRANVVLSVSDADAAALRKLAPGLSPRVVPTAVDTDHYRPTSDLDRDSTPSLLFSGTFAFRPNREAARWLLNEILPRVWQKRPETRIFMVGYEPPGWLVTRCMNDPRVAVIGGVEDDRPYLARANVCVLPITWGSGSRLKALVAMAAGVPIVSTALGMQGTEAEPGRHYLEAEAPEQFAEQICQLLEDLKLSENLRQQARGLAEERYDWRRLAPLVRQVYAELEAG